MFGWLNKFRKQEDGIAAVELGLATPIFLLMFLSVSELGHMIYYSIAVEKGMRSGVTYAARNQLDLLNPLIAEDAARLDLIQYQTENLTTRGTMDESGAFLVAGYQQLWELDVPAVTYELVPYEKTVDGTLVKVTIVKLSVEVPYVPLVPFITRSWTRTPETWIKLTHEQAIIGD